LRSQDPLLVRASAPARATKAQSNGGMAERLQRAAKALAVHGEAELLAKLLRCQPDVLRDVRTARVCAALALAHAVDSAFRRGEQTVDCSALAGVLTRSRPLSSQSTCARTRPAASRFPLPTGPCDLRTAHAAAARELAACDANLRGLYPDIDERSRRKSVMPAGASPSTPHMHIARKEAGTATTNSPVANASPGVGAVFTTPTQNDQHTISGDGNENIDDEEPFPRHRARHIQSKKHNQHNHNNDQQERHRYFDHAAQTVESAKIGTHRRCLARGRRPPTRRRLVESTPKPAPSTQGDGGIDQVHSPSSRWQADDEQAQLEQREEYERNKSKYRAGEKGKKKRKRSDSHENQIPAKASKAIPMQDFLKQLGAQSDRKHSEHRSSKQSQLAQGEQQKRRRSRPLSEMMGELNALGYTNKWRKLTRHQRDDVMQLRMPVPGEVLRQYPRLVYRDPR